MDGESVDEVMEKVLIANSHIVDRMTEEEQEKVIGELQNEIFT